MLTEIKTEDGDMIPVKTEEAPEFPHVERPPVVFPDMATPMPAFLYAFQQKVPLKTVNVPLLNVASSFTVIM